MIRTRSILLSGKDIPTQWGFKFYLSLEEDLSGQDNVIRSPFSEDRTASLRVYYRGEGYRYKCFSTGFGGDIIDLVSRLKAQDPQKPLSRKEALSIIQNDFYAGAASFVPKKYLLNTRGQLQSWELRKWNKEDYAYFEKYGVHAKTLDRYNVAPMSTYQIKKTINDVERIMDFCPVRAYGFLTKRGELVRIYNPGGKPKAVKVGEGRYILGSDQLKFKSGNLIITKSLKDVMCLEELDMDCEYVSCDAEGILLPKESIDYLKSKYLKVFSLMDNDSSGLKAGFKYKDVYGIDPITIPLSKDASDSYLDFGPSILKIELLKWL